MHKYSVFQGFLPSLFSFHPTPLPTWAGGGAAQTSFVVQMCSLPVAGLPCHVAVLDLPLGIMDSGGACQDRAGPISSLSGITNIASVSSHEVFVCHSLLSLSPDLSSSARHLTGAGRCTLLDYHMAHGGRGKRELTLSTASSGAIL